MISEAGAVMPVILSVQPAPDNCARGTPLQRRGSRPCTSWPVTAASPPCVRDLARVFDLSEMVAPFRVAFVEGEVGHEVVGGGAVPVRATWVVFSWRGGSGGVLRG